MNMDIDQQPKPDQQQATATKAYALPWVGPEHAGYENVSSIERTRMWLIMQQLHSGLHGGLVQASLLSAYRAHALHALHGSCMVSSACSAGGKVQATVC